MLAQLAMFGKFWGNLTLFPALGAQDIFFWARASNDFIASDRLKNFHLTGTEFQSLCNVHGLNNTNYWVVWIKDEGVLYRYVHI